MGERERCAGSFMAGCASAARSAPADWRRYWYDYYFPEEVITMTVITPSVFHLNQKQPFEPLLLMEIAWFVAERNVIKALLY